MSENTLGQISFIHSCLCPKHLIQFFKNFSNIHIYILVTLISSINTLGEKKIISKNLGRNVWGELCICILTCNFNFLGRFKELMLLRILPGSSRHIAMRLYCQPFQQSQKQFRGTFPKALLTKLSG